MSHLESDQHLVTMDNGCVFFRAKKPVPILITVPHDGLGTNVFAGLFEERKIGYRGRDLNVWPIVRDILTAAPVNALLGLMPRAFIDYNRSWPEAINYYPGEQEDVHTALDDARLAPAYHAYHEIIDKLLLGAVKRERRKTLLLDMHGFTKQPHTAPHGGYDLIVSTGNQKTIHHGDVDEVFARFMSKRGYNVFMSEASGPVENYYSAEFTVRQYAARHQINALQIEIAHRFRGAECFEAGRKLSKDFAAFLKSQIS